MQKHLRTLARSLLVLTSIGAVSLNARAQSCAPAASGMVALWRAENNGNDSVGSHHGTLLAGAGFAAGLIGNAFRFNGTSTSYVEVPHASSLLLTNELTIEFWVKRNRLTFPSMPYADYVVEKGGDWTGGALNYSVALHNAGHNYNLHFVYANGWRGGGSISDTQFWHHCAITAKHGDANPTLYIDGVQQPVVYGEGGPVNLYPSTRPLHIGAMVDNVTGWKYYSDTLVDDLAIYNRRLSTAEIQAIYLAGSAGKCTAPPPNCANVPSGAIAWWRAENNGQDSIGSHHGTVESGVTFAAGKVGQAFNVVPNGRVSVADSPSLYLTNSLSFEGWFNARRRIGVILNRGDSRGGYDPYGIDFHGVNNDLSFRIHDNFNNVGEVRTPAPTNQWVHFACTLDGASGSMRLYTNGVLAGETITGVRPLGALQPGLPGGLGIGNTIFHAFPFDGLIDDITLYNRTLSAGEVQAIYNAGAAGKCPPSGIVPSITSFSPLAAAPGDVVNIAGTGFNKVSASANQVRFGSVRAEVLNAGSEFLAVRVPTGGIHGPITVTVNGLVAYSKKSFEPTFAGGSNITPGSFTPRSIMSAGDGPHHTAIGDLDGDGKPDIAVVNVYSHHLTLYRNAGSVGSLTAASFQRADFPPIHPSGETPWGLTVADVDGDGKLDLLTSDRVNNQLVIYWNNSTPGTLGTNSFAPATRVFVGSDPRYIRVADLNADGRPDLAVINYGSGTVSVLLNVGTAGSLSASSFAPRIDFAVGSGPHALEIRDLEGDGRPDIVTGNQGANNLSVLRNLTGAGAAAASFAPRVDFSAPFYPSTLAIADIDRDGKPEIMLGTYLGGTMSVYRNQSVSNALDQTSFAAPVTFENGGRGLTLALGDINGDAKTDIGISTEINDGVRFWQNLASPGSFGAGSIGSRVDFTSGWNSWGLSIGDLDGDSRPDAVVSAAYDDTLSLYRNVTPFTTTPPIACVAPPAGLAGWWPFESNGLDSAGINNGILSGNPVFPDGRVGKAILLNGIDQSVRVPLAPALDVGAGTGLTIEAWIRPSTVVGQQPLVEWNNNVGFIGTHFWISVSLAGGGTGSLYANLVDTGGTSHLISTPPGVLSANAFQHVAVTYDKASGLARLFVNGNVAAQANLGSFTPDTTDDLFFGLRPSGVAGGNRYSGALDEISIYSRALGTNEIAAIHGAGSLGKCGIAPFIAAHPQNLKVSVGANATFTVTAAGSQPLRYQWFFNNAPILNATNSSFTRSNVLFSHQGTYFVTVSNSFGGLLSSNALLVVNRAPIASNSVAVLNEDSSAAVALNAFDADGDLLAYQVIAGPQHGTLSGSGSSRVYTPDPNYFGPDSFTFRVNDGILNSGIGTVTISVLPVNDAPVAVSQAVSINEDAPANILLTASDVDGDALTYTVVNGPAHGTLTGTAPNLTYQPDTNYFGPDSFTFRVSDGALPSAEAAFSITVNAVNDDPIAVMAVSPLLELEGVTNLILIAFDGTNATAVLDGSESSDPDGDSLDYTWLDGSNVIAIGIVTTNELGLGTHELLLLVSDGEAVGTDSRTVEVITPAETVGLLAGSLEGIPRTLRRALDAHLKNAATALDRGSVGHGIRHLQQFQHIVDVLVTPFDAQLAGQLIHDAQAIIDALEGFSSAESEWLQLRNAAVNVSPSKGIEKRTGR